METSYETISANTSRSVAGENEGKLGQTRMNWSKLQLSVAYDFTSNQLTNYEFVQILSRIERW
jgi:hypothetical protein